MGNAVSKIPLRQVQDVKSLLHNDQARQQLAAVAAKHMSPERLMRVTANAIRTTPKLQQCEPLSFLGALMQCAALGLEPNTVLGHAYLIPFDKKFKDGNGRWQKIPQVQVVIGYKGLIDLARRSGHITSISANIHYSDDDLWEYEEGTEAKLRHRPGAQDGEKLHAYAIAQFREGGHAYVVLPWAKVMKIRDGSQGWQAAVKYDDTAKSPWATHEDAMAMKTAIRALAKYLPLSVDFTDAVQMDHDGGARVDYASYAINPEEGATIDGDYIEGDASETPDDNLMEDERLKKEEKSRTEDDAKRENLQKARDEAEKPKDDAKDDVSEHVKIKDQIEGDLTDGAPVDATRQFYAEALEKMKAEAPDIFKEVDAMLVEKDD